jgi:hypothetical protein
MFQTYHIAQVLRDSVHRMKWLPGGYLLGDSGYGLSRHVLVPYRGVRYHLKEFAATAAGRPQSKEELFNLRHAQLRNIVERCFGLLKRRFKVLRGRGIDMANPNDIWATCYACVALQNFIRIEDPQVDNDILGIGSDQLAPNRFIMSIRSTSSTDSEA